MISLNNIDLAAIRADAEQNAVGAGVGDTLRLMAECERLRGELEAIKPDAERYQWLRDHYHGFEHYRTMKHRPNALRDEIDAARAKLYAKPTA